jgi:hypothetical protein
VANTNSNVSVTDNWDAMLTATARAYRKPLMDQVNRSLPFLYWLTEVKKRKRIQDGGLEIVIPLLYGDNPTVKVYGGYDVLDTSPTDGITAAFYKWAQMAGSITISREEERKNSGEHKMLDLLKIKTTQLEKSIKRHLADTFLGLHGGFAKTFTGGENEAKDTQGGSAVEMTTSGSVGAPQFNSLDHLVRGPWSMFSPSANTTLTHTVGKVQVSTTRAATMAGTSYTDWDSSTSGANPLAAETNSWWCNATFPGFGRLMRNSSSGGFKLGDIDTSVLKYGEYDLLTDQNTLLYQANAMRYMLHQLSDGADKPDLILCGQTLYENYEKCIVPLERFTDRKLADVGFDNLAFYGATMLMEPGLGAPSAAAASATSLNPPMYMLNSDYLEWVVDKETDFYVTPFYRPENQDARTNQTLLMAQLTCSNRSKQGVLYFSSVAGGWAA